MQRAAQRRRFVVWATFASPQQLPIRKLTAENQSKQTLRWECMRGFGWTDLNTISTKPPGLDKAWIKAALAAGSLQHKCLVWTEAKAGRSHMLGLHVVSAYRAGWADKKKKKQAVIQQIY